MSGPFLKIAVWLIFSLDSTVDKISSIKHLNEVLEVVLGFTTLLTSQVISVAFYSECEKSDKFCSETLISA